MRRALASCALGLALAPACAAAAGEVRVFKGPLNSLLGGSHWLEWIGPDFSSRAVTLWSREYSTHWSGGAIRVFGTDRKGRAVGLDHRCGPKREHCKLVEILLPSGPTRTIWKDAPADLMGYDEYRGTLLLGVAGKRRYGLYIRRGDGPLRQLSTIPPGRVAISGGAMTDFVASGLDQVLYATDPDHPHRWRVVARTPYYATRGADGRVHHMQRPDADGRFAYWVDYSYVQDEQTGEAVHQRSRVLRVDPSLEHPVVEALTTRRLSDGFVPTRGKVYYTDQPNHDLYRIDYKHFDPTDEAVPVGY